MKPITTSNKPPDAIESRKNKMEVCDYSRNINHNNNQSENLTPLVQAQPNSMAVLQRNTVSSASSLESSASYSYTLRQSPLNGQSQGISQRTSQGISQGMPQTMPAAALASIAPEQAMTSVAASSAIPSTHNNRQTPITVPMNTPFSLINSLKLKFPSAGSMSAAGGGSQFSDINRIPPVNPFSEETDSPIVGNTNVPEFLYQLIKMLTDNHREVIEWSNGKIEVHNPHKLESDVLNKYFRHSKYASFQRQLNYFGFRKLAGKGKMAPCSYVNELATNDLRSLLKMKRKTSATTKDAKNEKPDESPSSEPKPKVTQYSPFAKSNILTSTAHGIRSNAPLSSDRKRLRPGTVESTGEPRSVAKFAIGKGIRHSLNGYLKTSQAIIPNSIPTSNSVMTSTQTNPLLRNPTSSTIIVNTTQQNIFMPNNSRTHDPHAIAQSVVGKGVRHQFATHPYQQTQGIPAPATSTMTVPSFDIDAMSTIASPKNTNTSQQKQNHPNFLFLDPQQLGMGLEDSLSELQNNFRNSLDDRYEDGKIQTGLHDNTGTNCGKMERVSSLVNLAMIPDLNPMIEPTAVCEMRPPIEDNLNSMAFIDFPANDLDPSNLNIPIGMSSNLSLNSSNSNDDIQSS